MAKEAVFANADGVTVHYNALTADNKVPAVVGHGALGRKVIEMTIDGPLTPVTAVVDDRGAVIPAGARIVSAVLYVSEAFTSAGAAALNIGLYKVSDGTAFDADGIDAAVASSALSLGTVLTCDGAEIGKVQTLAVRLAVDYDTAVYTAGLGRLQVTIEDPQVQTT